MSLNHVFILILFIITISKCSIITTNGCSVFNCEISCAQSRLITWNMDADCEPNFEGIYPSYFFGLESRGLKRQEVAYIGFEKCNKKSWDWLVPIELSHLWNVNNGAKTFYLTAYYVDGTKVQPTPLSFTFGSNCEFEPFVLPLKPPENCPDGCFGPFANCKSQTGSSQDECTCSSSGSWKLTNGNECVYEAVSTPSPPSTPKPTTPMPRDCVLGESVDYSSCDNPCGPGQKKVQAYIVSQKVGTGADCEGVVCEGTSIPCRQRLEACNGLDDNRESCSATPAPPNAVGCDGCKCDNGSCQSSDRECRSGYCLIKRDDNTELGCKDCPCRATAGNLCDAGLNCQFSKCREVEKGCSGCPCNAGSCDETTLECSSTDICVVKQVEPEPSSTPSPPSGCPPGTEGCPCNDGTCLVQLLECNGSNRCAPKEAVVVVGVDEGKMVIGAPEPAEEDSNLVAIVAGSVGAVCCCFLCIVAVVVVVVCVIGSSSPSAQSGQVLAPIDSYNSNNTPVFDTQVSATYPSQEDTVSASQNYPSQSSDVSMAYPSQTNPGLAYNQGGMNPGGVFVCGICDQNYPTSQDLSHHQAKRH